jgi:hypothetical protein
MNCQAFDQSFVLGLFFGGFERKWESKSESNKKGKERVRPNRVAYWR